jgi:hypothetical protein
MNSSKKQRIIKTRCSFRLDPKVLELIDEWKEGTGADSRTAALEDIVRKILYLTSNI